MSPAGPLVFYDGSMRAAPAATEIAALTRLVSRADGRTGTDF